MFCGYSTANVSTAWLRLGKYWRSRVYRTYCFPRSQSIRVNSFENILCLDVNAARKLGRYVAHCRSKTIPRRRVVMVVVVGGGGGGGGSMCCNKAGRVRLDKRGSSSSIYFGCGISSIHVFAKST